VDLESQRLEAVYDPLAVGVEDDAVEYLVAYYQDACVVQVV